MEGKKEMRIVKRIKEWIRGIGNVRGDGYEFSPILVEIEERPLNPAGHVIYWLVLLFIVGGIMWLYMGRIDVVVSGRGIVVPEGEVIEVQSRGGVIERMGVKEGDRVEKGEVLGVVTRGEIAPEMEISRIEEEIRGVREQRNQAERELRSARRRLERLSGVSDIISGREYEEARERVEIAESEVKRLSAEIGGMEKRCAEVLAGRQEIKSPVDGYVDKVYKHRAGGVVMEGESLLTIVPDTERLQIRAKIRNEEIGEIRAGMPVGIKVDAYSFQRYGMLEGKVGVISADSDKGEREGNSYTVYIKPATNEIKTERGEERIRVGMTATVEIRVGERRLIEFFIYPLFRDMEEGMKVR